MEKLLLKNKKCKGKIYILPSGCNVYPYFSQPPQVPFPFDDLSNPLPSKQLLVTALVDHVNASLRDWSDQTLSDVVHLCVNNHRQFLELKVCQQV